MNKRIDEVVKHLIGTKLSLNNALKPVERDDVNFVREIYKRVQQNPKTHKWEPINVTA